jgi:hypothetical protein
MRRKDIKGDEVVPEGRRDGRTDGEREYVRASGLKCMKKTA